MLQFYNQKVAENMVCLEFDMRELPINLETDESKHNRKFRIINQDFIN